MARIAYYGAGGAPYHHAAILTGAGHDASFVFPRDILAGALDSFDAFVMPGGGYRAMQGQLDPLGTEGCRAIRDYVAAGGMYIGSCAGSYDAATVPDAFVRMCPAQADLRLLDATVWNTGDGMFGVLVSPGIGVLVAANTDPAHPVMAGIGPEFRITHYNGPLFTGGHALARVSGTTDRFTAAEDFLGPGSSGSRLVDRGVEAGAANIVAGQHGAGRVVLFGSHPEFGTSPAMDDTPDTARMLVNAIDWQVGESELDRPHETVTADAEIPDEVRAKDLAAVPGLVDRITETCAVLAGRTGAPWLAPDAAMSLFGRRPADVWSQALTAIPALALEAAAGAAALPAQVLSFRPPEEWPVDGGFHGVAALLEQAADMLTAATTAWHDEWPEPSADVYEHMHDGPYHLVAGSYLAAIGRTGAAALLVRSSPAS